MKIEAIKNSVNLISKYNQICNNYKTNEHPALITSNYTRNFNEKVMSSSILDFKS